MNILNVVHGVDGSLGIGLLAVTDKAKATAAASVTVLDDDLQDTERLAGLVLAIYKNIKQGGKSTYSLLDCAKFLELLTESILISVPCEAAAGSALAIGLAGIRLEGQGEYRLTR